MASTSAFRDRRETAIGLLALVAVCALFLVRSLEYAKFSIDDAFISYRYARNLAAGEGLCYNPGVRVEGFSNLAWVGLLGAASRAGLDIVLASKLLGAAAGLLVLVLVFALAHEETGGVLRSRYAALAPFFLAMTSAFVVWCMTGLETGLYTLALGGALYWALRWARGEASPAWTGLFVAAMSATRTEGAGLGAVVCAWCWLRVEGRRRWGPALASLPGVLAVHGFRYLYFGSLLSSVYWAKTRGAIDPSGTGLRYLMAYLYEYAPLVLLLFAVTAVGRRQTRPLGTLFAAVALFQLALVFKMGGDWMPLYRFLVPLYPPAMVLAAAGLVASCRESRSLALGAAAAVSLTLVRAFAIPSVEAMKMRLQLDFNRLQKTVAVELAKAYPPTARLVVGDIGNLGYYAPFRIIDMKGLVTPWISATYREVPRHGRKDIDLDPAAIFARRPELVLVAVKRQRDEGARDTLGYFACDSSLLRSPELSARYAFVRAFGLGGYPMVYWLFVRRDLRPAPPPGPRSGADALLRGSRRGRPASEATGRLLRGFTPR